MKLSFMCVPVVHTFGLEHISDFCVYGTKFTKGRLQSPTRAGMKARYNRNLHAHSETQQPYSVVRLGTGT